jgi:predicted permease
MARSFWELRAVDPGFDTEGILTLRLSLPEEEYATAGETAAFYEQLLEKLRTLPGVIAAGGISNLPLTDGESNSGLFFEDFPLQENELPPIIRTNQVTPGYFHAMGIPLREGRALQRRDVEGEVGAAILSAKLADRFYPEGSPIGRRVHRGMRDPEYYPIVGVVGDVRDRGIEQRPVETIYYPIVSQRDGAAEWVTRTMTIAIRTAQPPMSLAAAARETVWALNPRLPVANIRSITDHVARSMARSTYTAILLGIAAAMALLLGTIGIYGVISYIVSQRTREIGVRMALGAQRADVSRMILRQGILVSMVGILLGVIGTLALTRTVSALLYEVSSTDPITIAAVSLLLLSVTALASYIPARRAATVDPVQALRCE